MSDPVSTAPEPTTTTNEGTPATPPAQPIEQPSSEPAPEPSTEPTLTKEQIEEYNSYKAYVDSHGGFDKLKRLTDARAEQLQRLAEELAPKVTPPTPDTPSAPTQPIPQAPTAPPQGYISQQDMMVAQYYQGLANDPKYAAIADSIKSGSVLKEMAEFGIYPTDQNGFINDAQVRKFLDLKAQTVPVQQTSVEPTTTPTADYVNVGDNITTLDEAQKVLLQNETLRASGQAEHPATAKAKEFLANYLKTDHRMR